MFLVGHLLFRYRNSDDQTRQHLVEMVTWQSFRFRSLLLLSAFQQTPPYAASIKKGQPSFLLSVLGIAQSVDLGRSLAAYLPSCLPGYLPLLTSMAAAKLTRSNTAAAAATTIIGTFYSPLFDHISVTSWPASLCREQHKHDAITVNAIVIWADPTRPNIREARKCYEPVVGAAVAIHDN